MNFDTPAERKGTNSIKWDSQAIANIASNPEAEPFWVADMDFLPEEHIKKAGMALSDLGVYGYPAFHSRLEDAAAGWLGKKHGWNVDSVSCCIARQGSVSSDRYRLYLNVMKPDKSILKLVSQMLFITQEYIER